MFIINTCHCYRWETSLSIKSFVHICVYGSIQSLMLGSHFLHKKTIVHFLNSNFLDKKPLVIYWGNSHAKLKLFCCANKYITLTIVTYSNIGIWQQTNHMQRSFTWLTYGINLLVSLLYQTSNPLRFANALVLLEIFNKELSMSKIGSKTNFPQSLHGHY